MIEEWEYSPSDFVNIPLMCHNPRHETPCPLPCPACAIECSGRGES
jgi:hypothetical protein